MNLVKITAYACGCYSEKEYEETIYITEESYSILEDKIINIILYIGDLDGKHSETETEVDIEELNEEQQVLENFDKKNDGDYLYWELEEIFHYENMNFYKEQERVEEYIKSIDSLIEVTYKVKKSNLDKLNNFVSSLKEK